MRITGIEIKNFRAFYGTYHINLHKAGKNLLVYGENGSGKSSLYLALKLFLESSEEAHQFEAYRNIFHADDGYIKLNLRADAHSKQHTYEWSRTVTETNDLLMSEASKSKGFLDYKALLETHYVHREAEHVNVFKLLVENLLANTINRVTKESLGREWTNLQWEQYPRRNATSQIAGVSYIDGFPVGETSWSRFLAVGAPPGAAPAESPLRQRPRNPTLAGNRPPRYGKTGKNGTSP